MSFRPTDEDILVYLIDKVSLKSTDRPNKSSGGGATLGMKIISGGVRKIKSKNPKFSALRIEIPRSA